MAPWRGSLFFSKNRTGLLHLSVRRSAHFPVGSVPTRPEPQGVPRRRAVSRL